MDEPNAPRRADTVKIHGPGWLGGIEFSGQYVLAMLALVILGIASGVTAWLSYRSAIAQAATLVKVQVSSSDEHRKMTRAVDDLIADGYQTRCLLAILDPSERKDALRSGDVCAWIGVWPHRQPPLPEGSR